MSTARDARFGSWVASLVAAVSDPPGIADYGARKAALRARRHDLIVVAPSVQQHRNFERMQDKRRHIHTQLRDRLPRLGRTARRIPGRCDARIAAVTVVLGRGVIRHAGPAAA